MQKVLLHICCGVCALSSIERLKDEGFEVKGLFFNPNIQPNEEYFKRKEALTQVKDITKIDIIEGKYLPQNWLNLCEPYSEDKEGEYRCILCIEYRLKETFKVCQEEQFDYLTTTLTISPHKNSKEIIEIGKKIAGKQFLPIDFKKNDRFKKTIEKAGKINLYRQKYCGCIYSIR